MDNFMEWYYQLNKYSWIHSYNYLHILSEHESHAESNAINHLSIQVELTEL